MTTESGGLGAGGAHRAERETSTPGHASIDVWDLYADDGRYFFPPAKAGLPAQVSPPEPLDRRAIVT